MTPSDFNIEVENACNRSKRLLIKKAIEYSQGEDRLDQFKKIAYLNSHSPTEALWGMASKHITSLADMTKDPKAYNLRKWREKLTDLRNYTILLDALLIDLEVK